MPKAQEYSWPRFERVFIFGSNGTKSLEWGLLFQCWGEGIYYFFRQNFESLVTCNFHSVMIRDLDTDPWFFTLVEFPESHSLLAIIGVSRYHPDTFFEHYNYDMKGCINMPTASRHIIHVWIWELVVQVASMMNGSMQKCCLVYPILDRFKLGKLVILPTISRNDTRCCLLVNSWSCHRSSHEQLGDDGYITTLTTHDSFSWLNYGDRMWLVVDQSLTRAKVFSFFLTRTPLVSLFSTGNGEISSQYHLIKIILDLDISGIHPCLFGKASTGID